LKLSRFTNRSLFLFLLSFPFISLYAQEQAKSKTYVPYVGQDGKDVVWIPTPPELVNKMLEIAGVTEKDFVIDLGSGDGRTVIAAAKLGAQALGIEFNPDMVEISKRKAEEAGVRMRTKFVQGDLFKYDLSGATVITMFLLPEINLKLRPFLLDLKPGTRIVSNTFTMGDWEPDLEATTEGNLNSWWYTALMWIVPAKIEGRWNLGSGILTIRQEYQKIYGTLFEDNKTSKISEGKIKGEMITFSVNGATYTGKIIDKTNMSGTMTSGSGEKAWTATYSSPLTINIY
jgi:SAM-dependent methyltransferase